MRPFVDAARTLAILAAGVLGVWAVGHFVFKAW